MTETLLSIQHLVAELDVRGRAVPVVNDVSLSIRRGETLALVGESGCGKTMTAYSIMGLLPRPAVRVRSGRIMFGGRDLCTMREREMQSVRGDKIAMIFQEPLTALNPVLKIGTQIAEVLRVHRRMRGLEIRQRVTRLLRDVGIPEPERRINEYPHQLSGGMRQRVVIAMALACDPLLVIADEPTTALDVTVQAQVMTLLRDLQHQHHMAVLLITHDLGVVAESAETVAVMYAGRIMELADVQALFARPANPYTRGLLASLPHFARRRLAPIAGMVPALEDVPAGCSFSNRCPHVMDICRGAEPDLLPLNGAGGHLVRCWLYQQERAGELRRETSHPCCLT